MDALHLVYRLNKGLDPHNRYLSFIVEKVQLKVGSFVCYTNCVDYLKSEIENVNNSLGWIELHSRDMAEIFESIHSFKVRS